MWVTLAEERFPINRVIKSNKIVRPLNIHIKKEMQNELIQREKYSQCGNTDYRVFSTLDLKEKSHTPQDFMHAIIQLSVTTIIVPQLPNG